MEGSFSRPLEKVVSLKFVIGTLGGLSIALCFAGLFWGCGVDSSRWKPEKSRFWLSHPYHWLRIRLSIWNTCYPQIQEIGSKIRGAIFEELDFHHQTWDWPLTFSKTKYMYILCLKRVSGGVGVHCGPAKQKWTFFSLIVKISGPTSEPCWFDEQISRYKVFESTQNFPKIPSLFFTVKPIMSTRTALGAKRSWTSLEWLDESSILLSWD